MSKHPSPEAHKLQYAQEKMHREQLAFLRGPITRMEVQDMMQRVQLAMSTVQLSVELLAQFLAENINIPSGTQLAFDIEKFRAFCISKLQTAAAAQSGQAEPVADVAGQTVAPSGIVLTDGDAHAADAQRPEDSGEHADRVRE